MITSLRCKNFKCFSDTSKVELTPLTIVVGENNSGKTSLLHTLNIISITAQSEDPDIKLKLIHQDYDFGSFKDIVYKHNEKELITLGYSSKVTIDIARKERPRSKKINALLQLTYEYMKRRKEIYIKELIIKNEDSNTNMISIVEDSYSHSIKVSLPKYEDVASYISKMWHMRGFAIYPKYDYGTTFRRLRSKIGETRADEFMTTMLSIRDIIFSFNRSFRQIYHLGPLRVAPARTYMRTGEIAYMVGRRGELALSMYLALLKRGKRKDIRKAKKIANALYRLGFIKKIEPLDLGARYHEIWTRHKLSRLSANLIDSGFGASQVFPVIASLYTASPGSTLLYEQPEIHLHPAAQAELGSIFVNASSPDKNIIIETHSESLILRIQTEVARGRVRPEDVSIYYIKPKSSGHEIVKIPLNKKGEFLAKWPKGFFEENYNESLRLAKVRTI